MALPRIGLTVGDPAGIGPEVCARAARDSHVVDVCAPVMYGPVSEDERATYRTGTVSAEGGRVAFEAIRAATADALAGRLDAITTAPHQQGRMGARGVALAGTHRSPRASHRGVAGGNDVSRGAAACRAGHRAHPAVGGPPAADPRTSRAHDPSRACRAALVRILAPPSCGRGAQPSRRESTGSLAARRSGSCSRPSRRRVTAAST